MALVLEQKFNDGPIHIINNETGEHVRITATIKTHRSVKLVIDAPDNLTILRDVLYQCECAEVSK